MRLAFFAFFYLAFFFLTLPSFAQGEESVSSLASEPASSQSSASHSDSTQGAAGSDVDFSKASDRQLKEAQKFFDKCEINEVLSNEHDCRCLAGEYLTARIKMGDDVSYKEVFASVRNTCPLKGKKLDVEGPVGAEDLTDEQIEEAQKVYDRCAKDQMMRMNHDCKCLASRFIDKRKELGRLVSEEQVLLSLKNECLDGTEVSGYMYENCLANFQMLDHQIKDQRKFCECYANEYGKAYEKMTEVTTEGKKYLATAIYGTCRNEQLEMQAPPG